MTVIYLSKHRPVGTYRKLQPIEAAQLHIDEEGDAHEAKHALHEQRTFLVEHQRTIWNIVVRKEGSSHTMPVLVTRNGIQESKWQYRDRRAFIDMMNDNLNQAEIRGQAPGYPEYLEAIRKHAKEMAFALGVNEDINFYIPRERVFERPPCTDPPEIVAKRARAGERLNQFMRIFDGYGYR